MEQVGFNPASWSHWLLIVCFAGVSTWGLMLSWQWRKRSRTRRRWNQRVFAERRQIELSRWLAANSQVAVGSQNSDRFDLKPMELSKEAGRRSPSSFE